MMAARDVPAAETPVGVSCPADPRPSPPPPDLRDPALPSLSDPPPPDLRDKAPPDLSELRDPALRDPAARLAASPERCDAIRGGFRNGDWPGGSARLARGTAGSDWSLERRPDLPDPEAQLDPLSV